jgi:hypothetical protein
VEGSPDVVVVASTEDGVAVRLRQSLEKRGRKVALLDGLAAARLFTIHIKPDLRAVTPSLPMFVRSSAWWCSHKIEDPDERFLRSEAFAAMWSAAALCQAPVINRPGPGGFPIRMTTSAIASALGWKECTEIHASGPEMIENADASVWGEDLDFGSGPVAELRRDVPLRARRLNPAALYEIVTVVGNRAFSATLDSRTAQHRLIERSLLIARTVNVHFATITWAIDEQGATATRLNPSPEESEVRFAWTEVAGALCEDLES